MVSIKTESLSEFFGVKDSRDERDFNPYYLMKDEIYINNGHYGISDGDEVSFEIGDKTNGSGKILTNVYKYKALFYDDIKTKLVLLDFKIVID